MEDNIGSVIADVEVVELVAIKIEVLLKSTDICIADIRLVWIHQLGVYLTGQSTYPGTSQKLKSSVIAFQILGSTLQQRQANTRIDKSSLNSNLYN